MRLDFSDVVPVPPHRQRTPLEATRALLDVSVTERRKFRTCRRRWYYGTIENLVRKGAPEWHFDFGTVLHSILQQFYVHEEGGLEDHTHDWLDGWVADMVERYDITEDYHIDELEQLQELGFGMMDNYATYLASPAAAQQSTGTILAVEGEWVHREWTLEQRRPDGYPLDAEVYLDLEAGRFLVPIVDPETKTPIRNGQGIICLTAQIDLLTERKSPKSGLWIVDHKSAGNAPNDKGMEFDDQITGYSYVVWRWLSQLPRGVMFNYLIKDVPKLPRILQRGDLSTAKDQLCTPAMYLRALQDHGLLRGNRIISNRHAACYDALCERGWDSWFRRYETLRNESQIMNFERRLYYEVQDMALTVASENMRYPNHSTMHCPTCEVREICQAHENDDDVQSVIEQSFKPGMDRKA